MYRIPDGTNVIVDATWIGLDPDARVRVPIDLSTLHPTMVVCNAIADPLRNWRISDAIACGCIVLDDWECSFI
jgi:shikimate dehydrogenase